MALRDIKTGDYSESDHLAREEDARHQVMVMRSYLKSTTPPQTPAQGGVVFVDPERFPNDVSLHRVRRTYDCDNLNITYIPREALEHHSLSRYPRIDHLFRVRGFVSAIDAARFKSGQPTKTKHLARNRAATCIHFRTLSLLFLAIRPPKILKAKDSDDIKFAHYMGYDKDYRMPLVERGGLLMPLPQPSGEDRVHDAFFAKPNPALKIAETDEFGIIAAVKNEIRYQVVWEQGHSAAIHAGASPRALQIWQTQVLAYLRKIAWDIEFQQGPQLKRHEINIQEQNILIAKSVIKQNGFTDRTVSLIDYRITTLKQLRKQHFNEQSGKFEFADGLEELQVCVAALHGATYEPDSKYYEENNPYLHRLRRMLPAARWIGDLKRKRVSVLTKVMAQHFYDILHSPNFDDQRRNNPDCVYATWLQDRFADVVWEKIEEAAERVLADKKEKTEIAIVYDWTRDPLNPWRAEWIRGILKITGPLLDFPISEAAHWNEKAMALQD